MLLAACSNEPETALRLTATASLRSQLVSTADDAEETASGSVVVGSGARTLDFSSRGQKVGLRFVNLGVPQGAKITRAYLKLRAAENDAGPTVLTISAHATDSAPNFKRSAGTISSRPTTTAAARWSPTLWRKGRVYRSSDLADVVQEMVDRGSWDGDTLAFIISGDDQNDRQAVSANRSLRGSPTLHVWYDTGAAELAPPPEPTPTPAPEPTPPQGGDVGPSQREWHDRLRATIETPHFRPYLDPIKLAAQGDTFQLGRHVNEHMTSMMLAYRETGDPVIAKHINTVMYIAKSKLRDTNGDGYLNWLYLNDKNAEARLYYGRDDHQMDEMMTHAMVASMAYTLKQAGYSSSAAFWTDYLENHFEAKWRKRKDKPTGFPFVDHKLMHPSAQFIRYHLYMYKLTGKSEYYGEAQRMTGLVKGAMRLEDGGYIWSHFRHKEGCQPTLYVRLTTQAIVDVATVDSKLFDTTFMKRLAYTMARKVLRKADGSSMSWNSCGTGKDFGDVRTYAERPYAQLAPWDSSGRLEAAAKSAYAVAERYNLDSPKSANVAATVVFTLGR